MKTTGKLTMIDRAVCNNCDSPVGSKTIRCQVCGESLGKLKRSRFGMLCKGGFVIFQLYMAIDITKLSYKLYTLMQSTTDATAIFNLKINANAIYNELFAIWIVGTIILGGLTLLTKASKVVIDKQKIKSHLHAPKTVDLSSPKMTEKKPEPEPEVIKFKPVVMEPPKKPLVIERFVEPPKIEPEQDQTQEVEPEDQYDMTVAMPSMSQHSSDMDATMVLSQREIKQLNRELKKQKRPTTGGFVSLD